MIRCWAGLSKRCSCSKTFPREIAGRMTFIDCLRNAPEMRQMRREKDMNKCDFKCATNAPNAPFMPHMPGNKGAKGAGKSATNPVATEGSYPRLF